MSSAGASKEYIAFHNMKARMKKDSSYMAARPGSHYSELEHTDPPKTFDEFLAEVGPAPSKEHQLDRIDNTKGYNKGNLKWSTPSEQALNRSKRRYWSQR
jgi:hypothetical protein